MSLPASLTALRAERVTLLATIIHPKSGKLWRMPATEWLIDECNEFCRAGKLDAWLAYYGHFTGLHKK